MKECADDAACKASLKLEFETTSILDNKYIRRALDFVQIEGMGDCIVFEYVEGKSLAEHVRVGTLSEKQVKSVLSEVCEALYYLHRNGIVHCNLNPDNIMVTANDCRVKLIDIGVPETKQEADRELLIKEMEFVAPEIIKGEDFDSRADIYSLGKIMEFIGERNISKQFSAVATHCTQFSRAFSHHQGSFLRETDYRCCRARHLGWLGCYLCAENQSQRGEGTCRATGRRLWPRGGEDTGTTA